MPAKKLKVQVKSQKLKVEKPKTTTVKKAAVVKAVVKPAVVSRGGIAIDVHDVKGKVIGKASLPKELFGAKVNAVLMAQAVRVYLANARKGTADTQTRGEVTASTRKIYRQKGTGRARHGGISAPIFVGGGVAFGPKPRDYSLSLSKKMRQAALASALTSKLKDQTVSVVAGLDKLAPKTKVMAQTLSLLSKNNNRKILLVLPGRLESVQRAARNIEGVSIRPANLLTTYEVLNSNMILFMKDSLEKLEILWNKQTS